MQSSGQTFCLMYLKKKKNAQSQTREVGRRDNKACSDVSDYMSMRKNLSMDDWKSCTNYLTICSEKSN